MPSDPPFRHAIEVTGLRKVYTSTRGTFRRTKVQNIALDGIDLAIAPGELFGLLGPNGAGKTTTVKILTTLLLPTSGSAEVLGRDVVTETSAVRRSIGFVFGGERGLYWRLSGLDNLRYFADLYLIPPQVSKQRIPELLAKLGLAGREHDKVEGYSRGMKQRLHLARGLLNDPDVLFLDEPTIGLDPVGARDLRLLIRGLADGGKTIFLTTHYMFEADAICDRVAVIKKGKIVAQGTPGSIKQLVGEIGVVEFEVDAIKPEGLDRLRALPGVSSVVTADLELTVRVTIHCTQPPEVMTQLGLVLDGVALHRVSAREATLEDAYVEPGRRLRMSALVRAAWRAFEVALRLKVVSPWTYLNWLLFPVIFATIGLFMLTSSGIDRVAYGVLGGGIIGFWSVAYLDGGNSIQDERWQGTLEQIFAVPTPLFVIVIGKVLSSLLLGLLSFVPTVALAYFGFHAALPGLDPVRFAISLGVLTFSFFVIAVALTPLFAVWRWAFTVLNGLEMAVYGLCGFMFPISQLPWWLQPISYLLSPTWATRALYASANPTPSTDFASWWLAALGLSAIYLGLGFLLYRFVDARARVTGQLALA